MAIKDGAVLSDVLKDIAVIERRLSGIGIASDGMDAKQLLAVVTKQSAAVSIDFIAFSRGYLEELKVGGRGGTAASMRPAINNLIDFIRSSQLDISSMNSTLLRGFEKFIRSDRRQTRLNQFGEGVSIIRKGLGDSGVHNNMRSIRVLFNECRRRYNTEFSTVITHYPFDFYKIPSPGQVRKKGGDLSAADIASVRDAQIRPYSRVEIGRDMFMLSFYMCGMNLKDIYDHKWDDTGERIGYSRSKTASRMDGSYISVAVPDQARHLLDKYSKRVLHRRYGSYGSLITAVSKGLIDLSKSIGTKVTFYHARHTFATLAYNVCGFSKDDIAAALNHASGSRVTERYIAADWSAVDRVQRGVLDLLAGDDVVQVSPQPSDKR